MEILGSQEESRACFRCMLDEVVELSLDSHELSLVNLGQVISSRFEMPQNLLKPHL